MRQRTKWLANLAQLEDVLYFETNNPQSKFLGGPQPIGRKFTRGNLPDRAIERIHEALAGLP